MNQIKNLQKKIGTYPDGIIGKNTIKAIQDYYRLTKEEVSHFLGQCHHESLGFTVDEENLNYSRDALLSVFSKYFTPETAEQYKRKPEKIANKVYANRMGNGDVSSGDGWKYRGRGAIQLTGKNNYERFAQKIKDLNVFCNPELVSGTYFWDAAFFYFNENNLWQYCKTVDKSRIKTVTRLINGGYNGLQDRINLTNYYYNK
ncbi:glycoside hydrolase family 19 protein [Seonamhaeicola sp.]|uniref:glycoside hydrolase family 19 protein n=1 Tax=Seonamhaeicola sp. TaxID=1912245 RepID=UPI003563B12D